MKPSLRLSNWLRILFPLLLAAALQAPRARAADSNPPERLTYQGYLTDANGSALGTNAPKNYDVVFRIYDSQSGGSELWAEQQTVTVDTGYFSVLLGEGSTYQSEPHPLLLSGLFTNNTASDRYIEMLVKGIGAGSPPADVTLLPRLRLLTSPYAFLARNAVNATSAAGLVNSFNNPVVTITTNSYVGINKASPATPLDVNGTATATAFIGNGANLTGLNATNITSGTLSDARLSSNVPLLNGNPIFTGTPSFTGKAGFGTTNPGVQLDVAGAVRATNLWLGGDYLYGGYTVLSAGVSATYGGYSYLQSVQSSGTSYGTLALNASGGNVGIGTTNPTAKLDVNGSIQMGTTNKVSAVGGEENLKIIRGTINSDGTLRFGAGFTSAYNNGDKSYSITFNTPFSGTPSVTGSPVDDAAQFVDVSSASPTQVRIKNFYPGTGYWQNAFSFIAVGPR